MAWTFFCEWQAHLTCEMRLFWVVMDAEQAAVCQAGKINFIQDTEQHYRGLDLDFISQGASAGALCGWPVWISKSKCFWLMVWWNSVQMTYLVGISCIIKLGCSHLQGDKNNSRLKKTNWPLNLYSPYLSWIFSCSFLLSLGFFHSLISLHQWSTSLTQWSATLFWWWAGVWGRPVLGPTAF